MRDAAGMLFVAEGAWRDRNGIAIADPVPLATGSPTRGVVVNAEGEEIPATEIVDAGAPQPPDGKQLPEGGSLPADSSALDVPLHDAVPADVVVTPEPSHASDFDPSHRAVAPTIETP